MGPHLDLLGSAHPALCLHAHARSLWTVISPLSQPSLPPQGTPHHHPTAIFSHPLVPPKRTHTTPDSECANTILL